MLRHMRPALAILCTMTIITGLAYPLTVTAIARLVLPADAGGSLVFRDDKVIGSALIGQNWSSPRYFHGRPSAAGRGYDASASSGSNLGPTSAALLSRVKAEISALGSADGLTPADAATASASGLDPDISPQFAAIQVNRVAEARGLSEDQVRALVAAHVRLPVFSTFGEARINVLDLNLALDVLKP